MYLRTAVGLIQICKGHFRCFWLRPCYLYALKRRVKRIVRKSNIRRLPSGHPECVCALYRVSIAACFF